ncbi:hypothetical protein OE88DRAFT_1733257 [Heliocybe sulcata]|uniref:UbiA prenyltransferase n=1 Tax=Heliocybe sulcata TaxID=5364 RepID=A0A5C3N668_9AGAM|nr:hypothetical protein OE88DRAFT_1733257 [Heliocybe sulcata]
MTCLIFEPREFNVPVVWTLTIGVTCWIIHCDTIYACPDRKDDIKAGVKSAALLFGSYIKPILSMFDVLFIAALICSGQQTDQGAVYYVVAVGGTAAHLSWQLITLDIKDGQDCQRKFDANTHIGFMVAAGLLGQMYTQ